MRKTLVFLFVAALLGVLAATTAPSTSKIDAIAATPSQPKAPSPKTPTTPTKNPPLSGTNPGDEPIKTPAPAPTPTTPTEQAPPVATSPTPDPTPAPEPTPIPEVKPFKTGSFDGALITNKYEKVQVRLSSNGDAMTDITMIVLTPSSARSIQITNDAIPKLRQQALDYQTADVDNVSGATYTSDSYKQSLQAAIDQAAN